MNELCRVSWICWVLENGGWPCKSAGPGLVQNARRFYEDLLQYMHGKIITTMANYFWLATNFLNFGAGWLDAPEKSTIFYGCFVLISTWIIVCVEPTWFCTKPRCSNSPKSTQHEVQQLLTNRLFNFLSPPNPQLKKRFQDAGFHSTLFQEYSDKFPHEKYTLGYAGRPVRRRRKIHMKIKSRLYLILKFNWWFHLKKSSSPILYSAYM